MSPEIIINVVLVVLLVGWIGYRQTQWRELNAARMWRAPIILAVVGFASVAPVAASMTGVDVGVILLELAISVGIGTWMGAISEIRVTDGAVQARTGWWGLALWILMLLVRVGIDVVAVAGGAHAVTTSGVILLMFAANRAGRTLVLGNRPHVKAALAG